MKKYYNPHDWINAQNSYDHICEKYEPAIRYADILLQYAEALNELTQTYTMKTWKGEDVTISRNLEEMKKGIQPIRIILAGVAVSAFLGAGAFALNLLLVFGLRLCLVYIMDI